jgi:hypothetical protein
LMRNAFPLGRRARQLGTITSLRNTSLRKDVEQLLKRWSLALSILSISHVQ